MSYSEDVCSTCLAKGQLICCDSCPRVFHLFCLEDGFNVSFNTDDTWECKRCADLKSQANKKRKFTLPKASPAARAFDELFLQLHSKNPTIFELPKDIRESFDGIMSHPLTGAYMDAKDYEILPYGPRNSKHSKTHDAHPTEPMSDTGTAACTDSSSAAPPPSADTSVCYKCGLSGAKTNCFNFLNSTTHEHPLLVGAALIERGVRSELVKCDYCTNWWHLDCLTPPQILPPMELRHETEYINVKAARELRTKSWGKWANEIDDAILKCPSWQLVLKRKWRCPCHVATTDAGPPRAHRKFRTVTLNATTPTPFVKGGTIHAISPMDFDIRLASRKHRLFKSLRTASAFASLRKQYLNDATEAKDDPCIRFHSAGRDFNVPMFKEIETASNGDDQHHKQSSDRSINAINLILSLAKPRDDPTPLTASTAAKTKLVGIPRSRLAELLRIESFAAAATAPRGSSHRHPLRSVELRRTVADALEFGDEGGGEHPEVERPPFEVVVHVCLGVFLEVLAVEFGGFAGERGTAARGVLKERGDLTAGVVSIEAFSKRIRLILETGSGFDTSSRHLRIIVAGRRRGLSGGYGAFDAVDQKKEDFRKYLEKNGIIDALTKGKTIHPLNPLPFSHTFTLVLVGLYEEPEKPENPLEFVKQFLGGPSDIDVEALKHENEELKKRVEELQAKIDELSARATTDAPAVTEAS
ncbi:hypothetical protein HDU96_010203 [Phlyctochytrium bullatum]|nr:hypothetical protein HDU96_010203 [Phlyctochytrium bullatum]